MKNRLLKVSKNIIKTLVHRVSMPNEAYQYLKNGKKQIRLKNNKKAISIFIEGTERYPNNYPIRNELVNLAMKAKNWDLAIEQWRAIHKIKKKLNQDAYIRFAKALQHEKKNKEAEKILSEGLKRYPNNNKILQQLALNLTIQKKWKKAVQLWDKLFSADESEDFQVEVYINYALAVRKTGDLEQAEKILVAGKQKSPKNKKLLAAFADIAIYKMDWQEALRRIEVVIKLYPKKSPLNILMKKAMVNQIIGKLDEANRLYNYIFDNYQKEIQNDSKGYRKIIFFNNGESRIEFYKKLKNTKTAIVTFDSLNMVWKNPPFGFKLLSRQDIDIIAVRKKRPHTFHQDLSIEDFYNAVNLLLGNYSHKVAYGYSLGGYTSLYYGSSVDCTILSLAPRLSIHPKFGKPKEIPKYEFKHQLEMPYNDKISPIIVYDPKEKLDNRFVKEELVKAFPNANLVDMPYGGHGIAPHLLRMGQLKEFILTVLENKVPKYDRTLKSKSNIYLRVLGQACLKRNKLRWAETLANRSLELLSTDKYGIKLKINVLKRLEKFEEAIQYAKSAVEQVPDVLDVRELLIDLYIQINDINNAEKELESAIKKFGDKEALLTLKNKLVEKKGN